MKSRTYILAAILLGATLAVAQVVPLASSHATAPKPASTASGNIVRPSATQKAAVRVNGVVLTETDVVREMFTIFPYARQHNGFPKDMEGEIRRGATDMLIFEELIYQDAKKRNVTVSPERLAKAEASFRRQLDKATYQEYLRNECNGSKEVL